MDGLTVRYLTDAELVAARQGGPLEPYGAQRTNLPQRKGGTASSTRRPTWKRLQPRQAGENTTPSD